MLIPRRFVFSILLTLLAVPKAHPQNPIPGTPSTTVPTPGSAHDYLQGLSEIVDPANGSVSLRINVPIPESRGIALPFNFAYDTNGVFVPFQLTNAPAAAWAQFSTGYSSTGGWSYTVPAAAHDAVFLNTGTYMYLLH